MEGITSQVNGCKRFVRDLDPLWVGIVINFRLYFQAFLGRGCCDQVDDHFVAYQGLASPIHANMRKQTMRNLVPLACSWPPKPSLPLPRGIIKRCVIVDDKRGGVSLMRVRAKQDEPPSPAVWDMFRVAHVPVPLPTGTPP